MTSFEEENILESKFRKIEILLTDFDGVHTDGRVFVSEEGKEMVACSRRDGMGIEMLKREGVAVCIISKETNPVVTARAKKLGIECFQSIKDGEGKAAIIKNISETKNIPFDKMAYMGDDLNDIKALQLVGLSAAPSDCHSRLVKIVDYRSTFSGGKRAIRDLCEKILEAKGLSVSV